MPTFKNVQDALKRGQTAELSRLTKGVPNMLKLINVIRKYAGSGVPVAYLVVKGAWESAGVPTTQSKTGEDIGLFQIIVRKGQKVAGYTASQLLSPDLNTKVFVGRVNEWVASLKKQHAAWFADGDKKQLWGVIWLFGAIGSHATRHIMEKIGPGNGTFDRIVALNEKNPGWFAEAAQTKGFEGKSHWGNQSPEIIVFRIALAKRIMAQVWQLDAMGDKMVEGAKAVAPFLGLGVAAWVGILVATAGGLYLVHRRKKRSQGRTASTTRSMSGFGGDDDEGENDSDEYGSEHEEYDSNEAERQDRSGGIDVSQENDDGEGWTPPSPSELPPIEFGEASEEDLGAMDGGDLDHYDNSITMDIGRRAVEQGKIDCGDLPEEVCRAIEKIRHDMKENEKIQVVRLHCGKSLDGDGDEYVCHKGFEL